jgi:hypothetical protein
VAKEGQYLIAFGETSVQECQLDVNGVPIESGTDWYNGEIPNGDGGSIPGAIWSVALKAEQPVLLTLSFPPGVESIMPYWKPPLDIWSPMPAIAGLPFDADRFIGLWKSAMVINSLGLSNGALEYLHETEQLFFRQWPWPLWDQSFMDADLWLKFSAVVSRKRVARRVHLSSKNLFQLWSELSVAADEETAKVLISDETGWKKDDLQSVKDLFSNDTTWDDVGFWEKLVEIIAFGKSLGLPVPQMKGLLVENAPSLRSASVLRNVLKSRYSPSMWKEALKPLRDKLRQKQRDALTGYCCSHPINFSGKTVHFFDENDLYAYLLIDVEMEPDTLISRLKLAISSLQLFVQRLFMGLEEDDVFPDIGMKRARERWKWMKNYRVWEANRKVFLYPENWIEPELRDDKSEFFSELESGLLEDDLSEKRINALLNDYMEKLTVASDLEVVGSFKENTAHEGKDIDYVLYVIGRTKSAPYTYYQRTFIQPSVYNGQWTPWKRIDLEISAKMATPAVFNKRLYLFWLVFQHKTIEQAHNADPIQPDAPIHITPPIVYTEIKLMCSEYIAENNKWTKPRMSDAPIRDVPMSPEDVYIAPSQHDRTPTGEEYHIRVETWSNPIQINVYRCVKEDPIVIII